jgi:DNA-binding MarR family transcriptional regulator
MSDSNHIDAWATYFKSFNRIHQAIVEEIKAIGLPPMEVYDVLWTLEQAPEHRLRFADLSERVYLDRYNITRLADRLEEQGLLVRKRCPSDRRGVWALLTKQGLELRREMWKSYKDLIHKHFSGQLTSEDHKDLVRILGKVWKEKEYEKDVGDCGGS